MVSALFNDDEEDKSPQAPGNFWPNFDRSIGFDTCVLRYGSLADNPAFVVSNDSTGIDDPQAPWIHSRHCLATVILLLRTPHSVGPADFLRSARVLAQWNAPDPQISGFFLSSFLSRGR